MDKRYDHHAHEDTTYQLWEEAGAFTPAATPPSTSDSSSNPFTIMMPPPNANDPLHIGHAMFIALEDILIRFHRMRGDDTLWLPGTDHAGIETQFVFEKKLKKKKQSRFDFDRETLFKMIWDYVQENSDVAVNQMKKIGASADWSRFVFMLDPDNVAVVLKTFFKLHEEGLLYRDLQLVNYCTHCGTAFSSLEVDHEERVSPFFTIKYGPFEIGTVRPETKFRDTALAVNPNDPRYQDHIGRTYDIMGLLGPITMTIIPDPGVDPEFGTGIMKVTPAHDPHDFELGKEHNLPVTPIIDFNGRMDFSWYLDDPANTDPKYRARAEKYHGLKVAKMREEMKKDFEEDGLLVDYNPNYTHNLSVCYRCKRPIEPLPMAQFFISVKPLTEPILKDLDAGNFRVHGAGHDKILKHWLENLRDWNISRQIVWGIRLPIWYNVSENPEIMVTFLDANKEKQTGTLGDLLKNHSLEEITAGLQTLQAPIGSEYTVSETKPGDDFIQETDTFDTWFSSSQWPFSTLQALDLKNADTKSTKSDQETSNFNRFYPTQVMETGYDILPFWVMRMLMMGKFATRSEEHPQGQLPFTDVYLHGLARDQKGQKMSKSKGNVINPLEIIDKYGADALRMALVIRSSAGLDKSVGEADFRAMRNLGNKIWNAARFVTSMEATDGEEKTNQAFDTKLAELVTTLTQQINDFKLGLAAETIYNQFWHWYCDECIEARKAGKLSQTQLTQGLITILKLLHPFTPFVSEAVWQELRSSQELVKQYPELENKLLITTPWPAE